MSYHATVNCHTCGETLNYGHTSLPYGLKDLFAELACPVQDWTGKTGVQVLPQLQFAIAQLENDADIGDYRRRHHDDRADWDRVDFALPFLRSMRDAICRDPHATLSIT